MTPPPADLTVLAPLLADQWLRLRSWVGEVVGTPAAAQPSVLAGWTVTDLVVHLGRSMEALAVCTPAPPDAAPLTLAEYVGGYARSAQDIAATTRELGTQHADDPLAYVDAGARAAFSTLDRLGPADVVVQARRGPLLLSTMVTSRLVELVVHGDDLVRSVPRAGGDEAPRDPVDPAALDLVARALLDVVPAEVSGRLEVVDARRWVRLAAGRTSGGADERARALRPLDPSGAVPDLGRMLPVL